MKNILIVILVMFCTGCATLTEQERAEQQEFEEIHDLPSTVPVFVHRF